MINLIDTTSSEEEMEEVQDHVQARMQQRINFSVEDMYFKEKFRVSKECFACLLGKIGNSLQHQTICSNALDPEQQLLIALHWMGNGAQYHGVANMHGVSKTTVCRCVHRVSNAVVDNVFGMFKANFCIMHLLTLLFLQQKVDIDEQTLIDFKYRAQPLLSDHLKKRKSPLRIEVFQGSMDAAVENLHDVDAVVGIEVIEHVVPEVLEKVPENIFGFIQPKLVIFTTPNADYNVLFDGLLPNGFRHDDHKFEWTRREFEEWSLDICKQYPNYKVNFLGVGNPPQENMDVGHVTQIAIFARLDILEDNLVTPICKDIPANTNEDQQYKEIFSIDFPFTEDVRTKEEKIRDEAMYEINCNRNNAHQNGDNYEIPLSVIMQSIEHASLECTEEELRGILLENNIKVQGNNVIQSICPEASDDDNEFWEMESDEKSRSDSTFVRKADSPEDFWG